MRFEGQVAVVTGGRQGIGSAIARRLSDEGATVVVVDLAASAEEPESPGGLHTLSADVRDLHAVGRVMETVADTFGGLHILVNNAGITRDARLADMEAADWDAVISTNLAGTWNCCKAALAHITAAGPAGHVVNIASTQALGGFGQTNYAASKAGIIGLTRSLALEVATSGATVNAVAPGLVDTPLSRSIPAHVFERAVAQTPLRRPAKPEDVAATVAFLASADAGYITGQTVFVCGGYSVARAPI
jgi:3-oxoacyl-[acyl-carrier protein] reductase